MHSNRKGKFRGLGALALVACLAASASAEAEPPVLGLPIDCDVGRTCWLVNFVDRDPGPGVQDFRCGPLSYNTHRGVDFALRDGGVMAAGVYALAATAGTVRATRDGMPDSTPRDIEVRSRLKGRECGNGVVIDHADGWSTQYCHLKANSLLVRRGDRVEKGHPLGEVGQSGLSEFPHVHMTVRRGDAVIDPFTGDTNIAACSQGAKVGGLWAPDLHPILMYPGPQPYHLGFHDGAPDIREVRAGVLSADRFDRSVRALVFWVEVFSVVADDRIRLTLNGPDTEVIHREIVIDRPLARWFGFAGKKRPGKAWPAGSYEGVIEVARGSAIVRRNVFVTVE